MKKDYTDVTVLLDRSGSMAVIWSSVQEMLNGFIETQKKLDGEVKLSLLVFDSNGPGADIQTVAKAVDIKECSFDLNEYRPRGGTPLREAFIRTIDSLGDRLRSLSESERPEKVLFAVMTDGEENRSGEAYTQERLKSMTKHQADKYDWEFVYMGANQDSFANAIHMGIPVGNAMNFCANREGVSKLYRDLYILKLDSLIYRMI